MLRMVTAPAHHDLARQLASMTTRPWDVIVITGTNGDDETLKVLRQYRGTWIVSLGTPRPAAGCGCVMLSRLHSRVTVHTWPVTSPHRVTSMVVATTPAVHPVAVHTPPDDASFAASLVAAVRNVPVRERMVMLGNLTPAASGLARAGFRDVFGGQHQARARILVGATLADRIVPGNTAPAEAHDTEGDWTEAVLDIDAAPIWNRQSTDVCAPRATK